MAFDPHKFRIEMRGMNSCKVFIDGVEQRCVTSVNFSTGMNEACKITIQYLTTEMQVIADASAKSDE